MNKLLSHTGNEKKCEKIIVYSIFNFNKCSNNGKPIKIL